jgi:hypothetical protein
LVSLFESLYNSCEGLPDNPDINFFLLLPLARIVDNFLPWIILLIVVDDAFCCKITSAVCQTSISETFKVIDIVKERYRYGLAVMRVDKSSVFERDEQ